MLSFERVVSLEPDKGISVEGRIPEDLELFKDHFPAFPVLPGVLSLELCKNAAQAFLEQTGKKKGDSALKSVENVKFTHYLKPGDSWEGRIEFISEEKCESFWKASVTAGGRKAFAAKFTLVTEEPI